MISIVARIAFVGLLLFQISSNAFAGLIASSNSGLKADWSFFILRESTGSNCVTLDVRNKSNASAGTATGNPKPDEECEIAGLGNDAGVGNSANKPRDAVTASGMKDQLAFQGDVATGEASWKYDPGLIDIANYSAKTTVGTGSPADSFARARAKDPFEFYVDGVSTQALELNAFIDNLLFDFDAEIEPGSDLDCFNCFASIEYSYSLDSQQLFRLFIEAPSDFASIDDLLIQFTSDLGNSHDQSIINNLKHSLVLDGRKVELDRELILYKSSILLEPGPTYELSGALVSSASSIPLPATLPLFGIGLACIFMQASRRKKP